MWKTAVVASFKAISRTFSGEKEENHENLGLDIRVLLPDRDSEAGPTEYKAELLYIAQGRLVIYSFNLISLF
jgi:hypothetical protein